MNMKLSLREVKELPKNNKINTSKAENKCRQPEVEIQSNSCNLTSI